MVEDARDGVRRDLIEAQRKVRETEESRDMQRKDNLELKRGMNDEIHEKEAVQKTNMELRNKIKKVEQERISLKVSDFAITYLLNISCVYCSALQ